jgi:hypothetical protein
VAAQLGRTSEQFENESNRASASKPRRVDTSFRSRPRTWHVCVAVLSGVGAHGGSVVKLLVYVVISY